MQKEKNLKLVAAPIGAGYFRSMSGRSGWGIIIEHRSGKTLDKIWDTLITQEAILKSIQNRVKEFVNFLQKIDDVCFGGVTWFDARKKNVLFDQETNMLTFVDFEDIGSFDIVDYNANEIWENIIQRD